MAGAVTGARRNGTAPTRVLIAGGGVAALETMIALEHLAGESLQVQLLAPERDFVYRPLLVAEPFGRGAARRFSLETLAASTGASFQWDALTSVDPGHHRATTRSDEQLDYDVLVIAGGARARLSLPGAVTFWDSRDTTTYRDLLHEIEEGSVTEIVFSVPSLLAWPLPLYELAMMTATHAAEHAAGDISISIVTPEEAPLELFGADASTTVRTLLDRQGIRIRCGDVTSFPVRHRGIAAQWGDTVAEAIAADAGMPIEPTPLRPTVRGLLLTGAEPLWWPPGKIAGRYIAPHLASLAKRELWTAPPDGPVGMRVAIGLAN